MGIKGWFVLACCHKLRPPKPETQLYNQVGKSKPAKDHVIPDQKQENVINTAFWP